MKLLLYYLCILCFVIDVTLGVDQKSGIELQWKESKIPRTAGQDNRLKDNFETKKNDTIKDKSFLEGKLRIQNQNVHEGMEMKPNRLPRSSPNVAKSPLEARRYYTHLGTLVSDFANSLEATTLTLYTSQAADKHLLQFISRGNALMWNIQPCFQPKGDLGSSRGKLRNQSIPFGSEGESLSSRNGGEKIRLMVTLCDEEGAEATLLQMSDHLPDHVWLIAGYEFGGNWSPGVYIPIDSMVISAQEVTPGVFLLAEMWFPARYLGMKQRHMTTWHFEDAAHNGDVKEEPMGGNTEDIDRIYSQTSQSSDILSFVTHSKYDRRKDLSDVHFVVTFVSDQYAQFIKFDDFQNKEILSGFFGDIWETLRIHLNFTYTIRSPDDGEYGRFRNGSWTGLISDVLNNRADVIVSFLSQTYQRAQVIDYSSVLLKFSYRIFARPSNTGFLSWTSYTQPFTSALWASLAAVLFLIMVTFWGLSKYYQIKILAIENKNSKLEMTSNLVHCKSDAVLLSWAAFTQQGWTYTPDVTGMRIAFWTAYVFGVMILTSYSAKLVSFLTVTGSELPFDSLEDLKALGNYRLGVLKGSVLEDFFKKPTFSSYWNSLIAPYEDTLPLSYKELRGSALASPKYGYVGSYEVQRLDPVGACTFRSARQHLLFNDGSLAWGKGFPYGPVFNHFINKMREAGVLHKLKLKWYPEPYSCPDSAVLALDLKKVFTAFVLLAFGMGLGILILLVEKLYMRHTQKDRMINIGGMWTQQR